MIPTHLGYYRRSGFETHVVVDGDLSASNLRRRPGQALCQPPRSCSWAARPMNDAELAASLGPDPVGANIDLARAMILNGAVCPDCWSRFERLYARVLVEHPCRRTAAGPMPVPVIDHLPEHDAEPCPRCGGDDWGTFINSEGESAATCIDCGLCAHWAGGEIEVLA
jgi:hypothetical protein